MNALMKSLITFIYPAQCRHCGENLDPSDGHYVCRSCWQQAEFIERPYCQVCGYPLNPAAVLPDKVSPCDRCLEREKEIRTWFRKARSIAYYDSAVGEAIKLLKYHGKTMPKMIDLFCDKFVSTKEERDHLLDAIKDNRETDLENLLKE